MTAVGRIRRGNLPRRLARWGPLFLFLSLFLLPPALLPLSAAAAPSPSGPTPAGPWGGAISDLCYKGGDPYLFAATGNGLWRFQLSMADWYQQGDYRWEGFPATTGWRVLRVVRAPSGSFLYGTALPAESASYSPNFGGRETLVPHAGRLFRINGSNSQWSMEFLPLSGVSALAPAGTCILAATVGGGLYRVNPLLRPLAVEPVPDFPPSGLGGLPVWSLREAPGGEVLAAVGWGGTNIGGTVAAVGGIVAGRPGSSWQAELLLAPFGTAGRVMTGLGAAADGTLLAGTHNGQLLFRGNDPAPHWSYINGSLYDSAYAAPPNYPVTGFAALGADTFALVHDLTWVSDSFNARPGVYQVSGFDPRVTGFWYRWHALDRVSLSPTCLAVEGEDLVAGFQRAGVWRVPGAWVPSLPNPLPDWQWDAGICAVLLSRVVPAPRDPGGTLAVGDGGAYLRRGGEWARVLFPDILPRSSNTPLQAIRESRFHSAAFSEEDSSDLYLGCDLGLLRGRQVAAGVYSWSQVYYSPAGGGITRDILSDPFRPSWLWWAGGKGVYLSSDRGATRVAVRPETFEARDVEVELTEPGFRAFLAAARNDTDFALCGFLASDDGTAWAASFGHGELIESAVMLPGLAGDSLMGRTPVSGVPASLLLRKGSDGSLSWDPAAEPLQGLGSCTSFPSLTVPLGFDGAGMTDAFAVVQGNSHCLYWSSGDPPGRVWQPLWAAPLLEALRPTGVTADPQEGEVLWVATALGSAYTLRTGWFEDTAPPGWKVGEKLRQGTDASSVTLGWLSPGDDGDLPGWARRYELRRGTTPLPSEESFPAWGEEVPLHAPFLSRRADSLRVSVPAGEKWAFALRALDDRGQSSPILSTGLLWPATRMWVNALAATPAYSSVTVTWGTSLLEGDPCFPDNLRVRVERVLGGETVLVADLPVTDVPRKVDRGSDLGGFLPGDQIEYRVTVVDEMGNPGQTVTVSVTMPSQPSHPGVDALAAEPTQTSVSLSWGTVSLQGDPSFPDHVRIRVERTARAGTVVVADLAGTDAPGFVDHGADLGGFQAGEPVQYRVTPYDDLGRSGTASTLSTSILFPPPNHPGVDDLAAEPSSSSVTLSWGTASLQADTAFPGRIRIRVERTARSHTVVVGDLAGTDAPGFVDHGADLGGFLAGETVAYRVTPVDDQGSPGEASSVTTTIPRAGGGGGGGGCFIATAAFGTADEREVVELRAYRDRYLRQRGWGRLLVRIYERTSPPLARLIASRPWARAAVRVSLRPILWMVEQSPRSPGAPLLALGGAALLILAPLTWVLGRRGGGGRRRKQEQLYPN